MEAEIVKALSGSSSIAIMFILASGPVLGALILYGAYKISTKYLERFVIAVDKLSEQVRLTRELVDSMRREIDDIKDDVSDVKSITADNNKRLSYIENKINKN